MLDAQFFSKRTEPLTIVGPHELKDWFVRVLETSYPGSSQVKPKFDLELLELSDKETKEVNGLKVRSFLVNHGNPGGPFFAYRIETEGRAIAYSGDTEWTDALIEAGKNADLFVTEAYFRDKKVPLHLDVATLEEKLPAIAPKRLILTHMSDDMLRKRDEVNHECAEDGLVIEL